MKTSSAEEISRLLPTSTAKRARNVSKFDIDYGKLQAEAKRRGRTGVQGEPSYVRLSKYRSIAGLLLDLREVERREEAPAREGGVLHWGDLRRGLAAAGAAVRGEHAAAPDLSTLS